MSVSIKAPDENPSNVESILSDTIGLPGYTINPPGSRIEELLIMMNGAFASSIVASIDENFVMSITLKNNKGKTIGTTQTIDLPLESVIVSGSYDSTNKKLVFVLENGNTIDVPIGDLISGLQEEITSTNKLDADLVDDSTSTNKFNVQANWTESSSSSPSFIQNKPITPSAGSSDPIMDGIASAGTASTYSKSDHVHPTDTSRQAAIDSNNKLSADLVDDSSSTNKFAMAEELQQIETNKNNISAVTETVQQYDISKNLFNPSYDSNSGTGWAVERNFDNTYNVIATGDNSQQFITIGSFTPKKTGTYIWTVGAVGNQNTAGMYIKVGDLYYWGSESEGTGQSINLTADTAYVVTLRISANQTLDLKFKPMIRQTGDETYTPFAKSNADITSAIAAIQAQLASQ